MGDHFPQFFLYLSVHNFFQVLIPLTKTLLSSFVGDRFLVLGLITAHNRNCVLQQTVVGGDGLHCSALPLHTCALPSPVSAPVL